MKKMFHIYVTDWRNIFKVPIALFLIVGLMILPSLYAWFNIKGAWDPYGDTSGIAIAVTNEDEGAVIDHQGVKKEIKVGEEVVKSLKDNPVFDWTFVSTEEAERGVNHGDYYASIFIPNDFSAQLATILEENPEHPEIQYSVNEKINAIAPKITAKGATSIIEEVNKNFVKTVSEALFTEFNKIGLKLEKELPTIRHMKQRVFELEKRLPAIEEAGKKALAFEQKLPEIRDKGEKIVELEKKIPEIMQAGNYILKLEESLPKIEEVGNEIIVIQQKLPDIQKAVDRIVEIDQNFYKVEEALNKAIENAEKADVIIREAQETLPKVEKIAKDGGAFAASLNDFLQQNDGAFAAIAPVIKQNISLLQQTADAVTQLTDILKQEKINPEPTLDALAFLQERLASGATIAGRIADLFTKLNAYLPTQPLDHVIQRLNDVQTNFEQQIEAMKSIQTVIERGEQPAKTAINNLNSLSKNASRTLGDILERYDTEIVPSIQEALANLKSSAQNAADVLEMAQTRLPDIEAILDDAAKGVDYSQEELARLKNKLPAIRTNFHEAAETIQGKMDQLTEAVNQAAAFMKQDWPQLEPKIREAAEFVRTDLPKAEEEIHQLADFIQQKLPEIEESVHRLADLVRTDLPELEDSVRKAADKIRQFEQSQDLDDIIALLKNDIQNESDFLANPVHLKENKKFPIPNYGSAMSPFYTTLSLWVGALLLVSLLRFDVENPEEAYKSHHIYFGRLFTFWTIGFFQALIVTIGDMVILGAYVADPFFFVLFGILISLVFMTIVYTFVSVFGNIGKAFAIIMLVLQLSASGGTFPVQVTPPFFQAVHPFLPFTYAISLMRETVGGMLADIVIRDIVCLLLFLAGAFLIGVALKGPLSKSTKRVTEMAKKSKIIH
ncbi:YhgE/Pip domain-containing protein [Ureibacillus thermosphaericus]|uniref:YhgE/Pip domain-containing protein n=1 Tax=Ureibacillus thermosphaericus TaxID=51173 RepID=UPI0030C93CC7